MITPSGHKILVKPEEVETQSAGGIIYGNFDEKMEKAGIYQGTLVAYGNQAWKAFSTEFDGKPWAEVGDYVFYSRYAGKILVDPMDGAEYMIMNDEDILAVVTEGSNNAVDNELIAQSRESNV